MVKTLVEFYDGLSERGKQWMRQKCNTWLDVDQPDYYKKKDISKEGLIERVKNIVDSEKLYGDLLLCLKEYMRKDSKYSELVEILDTDSQLLRANRRTLGFGAYKYLPVAEAKAAYRDEKVSNESKNITLVDVLYMTEDYDNIRVDLWTYTSDHFNTELFEVFSYQNIREMCKKEVSKLINLYYDDRFDSTVNKLIDDLFFCEDGLSWQQKYQFLNTVYQYADVIDIKDFFDRFVTVDKYYLKWFGNTWIHNKPERAEKLYNILKPEEDLVPGILNAFRYRYNPEIRKFAQLAGCCKRGRIPKTRVSKCGDIASLLKIYSYDINQIAEVMFPEICEAV